MGLLGRDTVINLVIFRVFIGGGLIPMHLLGLALNFGSIIRMFMV